MSFAHAGLGLISGEPGFEWSVFEQGDTLPRTPATLYSDQDMDEVVGNSFVADNLGQGSFYAAPGLYDLLPGITPPGDNYFPATVMVPVNPLDADSGGGSIAEYGVGVNTDAPYQDIAAGGYFGESVFDGEALTGEVDLVLTIPVCTFAEGGLVAQCGGAGIEGLPSSTDGFNIVFSLVAASLDGANSLSVSGTTTIPPDTPDGSFDLRTLSIVSQTGEDLVLDPDTGNITTTAGGVYGVMASAAFLWD